ncbi:NAD-dependent epimerase/dehydratase family protein [Bacteroidetes/Chlorobi group bacterium Naka2016]|jgi:dTDP-4-dehydrorhamnose reductase|nr:MAG: NAD-dependent epimerase/dehydratase family protein [Bacteroidetes/Chlorobi group bacterium Naka2016]
MSEKKIALVGPTGIVGEAIVETILQEADDSWSLVTYSNRELSVEFEKLKKNYVFQLTDFKQLRAKLLEEKPNVIINAVGISDREFCEKNKQIAWQVNVQLVEHLVSISKILNSHLITFSCEDIFDGNDGPYFEKAKPNPKTYLGKTKLAAENLVISNLNYYTIIRLPLVYGVSGHQKKDIVGKILSELRNNGLLVITHNYKTNPVLSEDVAWGVFKIIEMELTGTLHFGGFDYVSMETFAEKIAKFFNLKIYRRLVSQKDEGTFFGLQQSYAEALLSIKFSSISEGLMTYKYLDREQGSDFERLMNY